MKYLYHYQKDDFLCRTCEICPEQLSTTSDSPLQHINNSLSFVPFIFLINGPPYIFRIMEKQRWLCVCVSGIKT